MVLSTKTPKVGPLTPPEILLMVTTALEEVLMNVLHQTNQ